MPLLVSDAIVLHVSDYLESSRLLRLATREAGVVSVVARGARSSKKRFGSAVDLFAIGQAQIDLKPGRDLHSLNAFDVQQSQPFLAADLRRFSAASAFAEVALRVVHDESAPVVFGGLLAGFSAIGRADGAEIAPVAISAIWKLVRDVGFAPVLEHCAECHEAISPDVDATFSHEAGGVLCPRCAARAPGGRRLPAAARLAILSFLRDDTPSLSTLDCRAHQRLLREFLAHHLTDGRPLRAYVDWEAGTYG